MDRPNILFFFTDDQRFDTVNALGNAQIATPCIDGLARSGTAFSNAYIMGGSCPAVCMPSRAMLMTGRTLFHLEREGQDIPAEHVLLGEALRDAGYRTFGTGKWHNGASSYARSFTDGAEIFFGGMEDHWNVPACRFDPTGAYDVDRPMVRDPHRSNRVTYRPCDHVTPGKHSSELFCEAAIDFIRGYDSQAPFFAYVSFMAPHDPRTMPEEYRRMYSPDEIPLPRSFVPEHPFDNGELEVRDELLAARPRTEQEIRRHIAEYYAMITHLDAQMGRVLEALEETGRAGNTIVLLAGDNGLAIGRHGLMGKQNLYEHSLHVPLVVSGPGVPAGQTRETLCYLLDIFPTLCEMAGVDVPDTVEGQSLVPALRGRDQDEGSRDTLLCAYRHLQRSARDDRYKLIEYVVQGRRTTQLFDLQEDPWETVNLAGDPGRAGDLERLRGELLRWREELDDPADAFWDGCGAANTSSI